MRQALVAYRYSFWLLWECMARNGNCMMENCWRSSVTCSLRPRRGLLRKQPLEDPGLSRRRIIYRHEMVNAFWLGWTAIKGSWIWCSQEKAVTTGWGKWVSPWGKPPPLKTMWSRWWWQLMWAMRSCWMRRLKTWHPQHVWQTTMRWRLDCSSLEVWKLK